MVSSKRFFGIFIILFLLVNISLVITQNELTDPEKKSLRDKGLEITESTKIGDRIFTPIDGEGFVKTVEVQDKKIFLVGNVDITTGQNIEIKTPKNRIYVLFEDVDILKVTAGDVKYIKIVGKKGGEEYKDVTVSGKKFSIKYDSKNPPKFVLDGEGNLAEGTEFEAQGGDDKYPIGGYNVELPEGAKVKYVKPQDGKKYSVEITMPIGGFIYKPELAEDGSPKDTDIKYKIDGGWAILENGERILQYKEYELKIGFDGSRDAFYFEGPLRFSNALDIGTIETKKVYWFSDGKEHAGFDQPYISTNIENGDFVAFAPDGMETPSILFRGRKEKGRFYVGEKDNLIIQALGKGKTLDGGKEFNGDSLIKISQKEGDIPLIETSGGYAIVDGNRLIRWNNGLENGPRAWHVDSIDVTDSETKKTETMNFKDSTAAVLNIKSLDSKGGPITYKGVDGKVKPVDFEMFVSKEGDITVGRGKKDIRVRRSVAFNNLNKIEKGTLLGMSAEDQVKLLGKDKKEVSQVLKDVLTKQQEAKKQTDEKKKAEEAKKKAEEKAKILPAQYKELINLKIQPNAEGNLVRNGIEVYNPGNLNKLGTNVNVQIGRPNCGPCVNVHNQMKKDYKSNNGATYLYIDAIKNRALAIKFGYKEGSLPQTHIFRDGQKIKGDWMGK